MTVENCIRLLEHYESKGMEKEAEDMRANLERRGVKPAVKEKVKKSE